MLCRSNFFSWTTYPPKQNGFHVWKSSFGGELVLLVIETNVNLISSYDYGFNKLMDVCNL